MGIQTIVSRQMELTREAAVISVGRISGGVRNNIIPEEVELEGTIRTLDVDMQADLHDRLRRHANAGRINDYYACNHAIHEAIIALADNRWLAQTIGDLRKILKLARLQQLHAPGRLKQSLNEHLAVFAALKARDADGAETAMRTHLTRQREALRELARSQKLRVVP